MAFFLPITANRAYDPVYELSFNGVNNFILQSTLGITALLIAIMICAMPNVRFRLLLPISTAVAIIFQVVISQVQRFFVMHLYLSIPLSVALLAAIRAIFDSQNLSIRSMQAWTASTLGLQLAPIPTGLLLAQVVSNLTF